MSEMQPLAGINVTPLPTATATPTAAHIMVVIAETFTGENVPLARRARGILARQSKELLEDGFQATVVARACIVAERRGEPHNAWRIAGDIARVEAGIHMTRTDYEKELKAQLTPGPSALLLQVMEERNRRGQTHA